MLNLSAIGGSIRKKPELDDSIRITSIFIHEDFVIGVIVQSGHSGFIGQVVQGVGSEDVSVTGFPFGSLDVTVAKLYTYPVLMSSCVIT